MASASVPGPDRRSVPAGLVFRRWRAPDGWDHRAWAWPADGTPRGSLIVQTGRADHLEKYVEALHHLHGRGWSLAGFDWRGQGGSGHLGRDPAIGHCADFDPLLDDLDAFVRDWRAATPGPHLLAGHSMGGHLVLRLLAERAPAVDGAALVAPMLGLRTGPLPPALARAIARGACRLGLGERTVLRSGPAPRAWLTGCPDRYADAQWWRARHPELSRGEPSWGWVAAAFDSIARLCAPGVLERVTQPVLLLAAARDALVSTEATRAAAARLPDARLHIVPDAAHELLREADRARLAAFAALDAFLEGVAA